MINTQELRIPAHRFRQGGRDVYAACSTCPLSMPDSRTASKTR